MSSASASIRVLHVDDDPGFGELTATFLEREDEQFRIETETSAADALATLHGREFDCVVADYEMPDQNGIELLQAVRADYPNLPFILFTGKGSEEVASEAISAGVTDYLQKDSEAEQYTVLANRIRNAVERARAKTEQQRKLDAIETAREGISILDEDRQFIYVNQAYADLYGYAPDELLGESWELLYQDEHLDDIRNDILPAVEAAGYWHGETIGVRATGETFTEDHVLALTDNGELVCTVRDVTDQRERAQELERAQTRCEALFENSPDMINIHDKDGIIRSANRRFCDELGYDEAEIVGQGVWEIDPTISPDDLATQLAETDTGDRFRVETEFRRNDGSTIPVEVHVARLNIADDDQFVVFSRDISERKEHEQRLEALNETSHELLAADSQEEIAEISVEAARDIIGLDANVLNLYDADRDALVPASSTEEVANLIGTPPVFTGDDSIAWRAYTEGEARAIDDVHTNPDVYNPETPIRSELYLPVDEYGILVASSPTTAAFDREDRVLGELLAKSIAVALENLEQTERLQKRKQELSDQNERLDQFARFVSHDLRNPLTVAEGHLELAREDCDNDHLATVAQSHDRMRTLIDELLSVTRESDPVTDRERVSIAELSAHAWEHVETKQATLTVDVTRSIRADRNRVTQLLENLFRNAVEHGGDNVTVTVGDLADGFFVEDDGRGLTAAEQASLFEAGYSTAPDGTGFGLPIVKQVVEDHEWQIHVTDGADGGARIEISGLEFDTKKTDSPS
ncbi:PAS domain S-box protein [Salarchaeum sp. JOR-1]|uniref:hybrid sensor histidine kinase/response regulator n=1 Tax=Salarchaeum sp. JOR-1 TaxID=2599399 RepID=UPI0011989918|nr:PAS domain S-box protein [Salarchaeum sp. JOR-1]QDX40802.1 PAS domain S-box protein [Salarchaeum sp. JOR-1]